ncbi:MAG: hypothetical protein H0W43_10580 [Chthoniobacterales bacterium]|nr:hypothetical protein [Chthoniobacterales bacterium]
MELPSPPAHPPGETRAPASGLKLMLGILVVFAVLAGYGQWQNLRRAQSETVTIVPAPQTSPAPSPNEN